MEIKNNEESVKTETAMSSKGTGCFIEGYQVSPKVFFIALPFIVTNYY